MKKPILWETLLSYALMVIYAIYVLIIGTSLPYLLSEFGLPLAKGGLFAVVQNSGGLLGIVCSGILIDRFSKRKLALVVYGIFCLGIVLVSFTRSLPQYLVILFASGITTKLIEAVLNSRISIIHKEKAGQFLSLLHGAFCLGALGGPLVIALLFESGYSWRVVYLLLGITGFSLFVLYGYVLTRKQAASSISVRNTQRIPLASFFHPSMILLVVMAFFCGGYEVSMNNWLPTYVGTFAENNVMAANSSLSWLYLGFFLSRVLCSLLTRYFTEKTLVILGCLPAAVILCLSILFTQGNLLFAGIFSAGLLAGGSVPMILTMGYSLYSNAHGKVSMTIFTAIALGTIVVPWLIGSMAEYCGLQYAMLILPLCLCLIGLLGMALPGRVR